MPQVTQKVCLIIHDGWGIAPPSSLPPSQTGNAILAASTPTSDFLVGEYESTALAAHGLSVGVHEGQIGSSEVGHLNLGAGRVVWQDIVRIDQSIKDGSFINQPNIASCFQSALRNGSRIQFLGLLSNGGVHSHISHLMALLKAAKVAGIKTAIVQCVTDGRDVSPTSAPEFIAQLREFIRAEKYGQIGVVIGRHYAMDRDKRWDRVKVAVDAFVQGEGEESDEPEQVIKARYAAGATDQYLEPIVPSNRDLLIKENDVIFTFNYRSDRMREIVSVLGITPTPMQVSVPAGLNITTMSQYNAEFKFPIAFPAQELTNVLSEWLSKQSVTQEHIAETEKYAHVTFFFGGGVEKQYPGEDRQMIPSPAVRTYDMQPEMNVDGVANAMVSVLSEGKKDFVMCNFAAPDMVAHCGLYEPTVKAIEATDKAVRKVYDAAKAAGYVLFITSDHGNAEQMIDAKGGQMTAHTTNPVPFIMCSKEHKFREDKDAALCNVAPTLLHMMGLPIPEEMTAKSLLA